MNSQQSKENRIKEQIRIIRFQDSSDEDDDDNNFQHLIETFVQVQLRKCRFKLMEKQQRSKVLDLFPQQMYKFVQQSYVIHDSQISTVLLGLKKHFKPDLKVIKYEAQFRSNQEFSKVQHEKEQLIIVKAQKQTEMKNNQILRLKGIQFFKLFTKEKQILILKQNFKGINFGTIVSYFSENYFIPLNLIVDLTQQLIEQVKSLHQQNIIHGDINIGNVVVRNMKLDRKEQYKKQRQEKTYNEIQNDRTMKKTNQIEALYKTELKKLLQKFFIDPKNNQEQQNSQSIRLSLIDYSHSWIEKQNPLQSRQVDKNHISLDTSSYRSHNQNLHQYPPTQTINYRSPQALYSRGSYHIDIWGIGHVIFTLLTGELIFNPQISWTQQQLLNISSNQQQFNNHIKSKLKLRQQMINKSQSKLYQKLYNTLMMCLSIDQQKRPTIKKLYQQWIVKL